MNPEELELCRRIVDQAATGAELEKSGSDEERARIIVRAGKEMNVMVTTEAALAFLRGSVDEELAEDELDKIAGGGAPQPSVDYKLR